MPRTLCAILLALIAAGCTPSTPFRETKDTESAAEPVQPEVKPECPESVFTVFLTGNTLSSLKPCGCAEGQLGGFERRAAILNSTARDKTLIIDTGNMLIADTEQDTIKLSIIVQALSMLDYDIVNLTEDDYRALSGLGLIGNTIFRTITSQTTGDESIPAVFEHQFPLDGNVLTINVASLCPSSEQFETTLLALSRHTAGATVNIAIIDDYNDSILKYIAGLDVVDVVVCPTAADEPGRLDAPENLLALTVGRLGKYVVKLSVSADGPQNISIGFEKLEVSEQLPTDPELAELYKYYQLLVKEANLLEKVPKVPLPDGLEYLGTRSCDICHEHRYNYQLWSQKAHAGAYQTLVEAGSQYDPECIVCHVVGLNYETGFFNEQSQLDLRDVGCEVCHGPGLRHMIAITMDEPGKETTEPKVQCTDCHTPEHSPGYQGHDDEYLEKIIHWVEQ